MFRNDSPEQVETNFGTGIKMRREHLGMTQLELAEATGVNQSTVAKWEQRATTIFKVEHLASIAKALHTTTREIRGGLVPRSYVNPDTEESMMVGPMRDLRRLRQLDGALYDTAVTTLAALRREAERKENHSRYMAGLSVPRGSQSVMDDSGDDEYTDADTVAAGHD